MKLSRIMIAGTSSGSGKTTAVCSILALLKRRSVDVRACKCGPDYIDPMFHKTVSNVPCANLDPFFCDRNLLNYLLCENSGGGLTVIEGVMGYYDGTGKAGTENSSYTVSELTEAPVILVADAKGASSSLLAVIEGFLDFVPDSRIRGVLFNRISPMNYKYVSSLMKERFADRVVPVGYLPELPEECRIPSRHLGLVTANEITDLAGRLKKTADLCENTIDLDKIISLADSAPDPEFTAPEIRRFEKIVLAAAYDNAFCFYYSDTFELFRKMGAEIKTFSPLDNEPVPEDSDGLLLGGGYPELYTETLEKNEKTKESVRRAISSGMPVIAECGGFQYLGETLDGRKTCGVLGHSSSNAGKLVRFGYITLSSKKDGVFGPAGTTLKAHEFHYWDSTDNGSDFTAEKPNGRAWECAVTTETLYAGYPHLFLPANITAAENFYKKCIEYKEKKK